MSITIERTIRLSADDAAKLDALVASGKYPDEAAVISDAMDSLIEYDENFEKWAHEVATPICNDITAGRGKFFAPQEILSHIETRRASKV